MTLFFAVAAAAWRPVSAQAPAAQPAPPPTQPAPGTTTPTPAAPAGAVTQPPAPGGSTGGGAASQQVVVNPPSATAQPQSPPSSTTVVNPPPSGTTVYPPAYPPGEVTVVERRPPPNPMATVATDAAYGGVAGLLVGTGVGLVNEWDTWRRDVMVGTGVGLILGAAVGVAHAAFDQREYRERARRADAARTASGPTRVASDGMNRTDRDPILTARAVGFAVPF
jgi:hypothetical protein